MVVPKRLHLTSPAPPEADGALQPSQQAPNWGPVDDATLAAVLGAAGGKFASGFTSSKLKPVAEILWRRLRQDGPPFFRKVRTRAALDVLEDESAGSDAVSSAAEELWGELCGQTWRVELDYGLEGSEAEPRDELLLACGWLAARRLLSHAGLSPEDAGAAQCSGVFVVDVSGYNAASEQGGAVALSSWRDLRPRLQPLAAVGTGAAAAAAAAARAS